jgi:hypothetical protein
LVKNLRPRRLRGLPSASTGPADVSVSPAGTYIGPVVVSMDRAWLRDSISSSDLLDSAGDSPVDAMVSSFAAAGQVLPLVGPRESRISASTKSWRFASRGDCVSVFACCSCLSSSFARYPGRGPGRLKGLYVLVLFPSSYQACRLAAFLTASGGEFWSVLDLLDAHHRCDADDIKIMTMHVEVGCRTYASREYLHQAR